MGVVKEWQAKCCAVHQVARSPLQSRKGCNTYIYGAAEMPLPYTLLDQGQETEPGGWNALHRFWATQYEAVFSEEDLPFDQSFIRQAE